MLVFRMLQKRRQRSLPEAYNNPGVIFGKSYYGRFYVPKKEKSVKTTASYTGENRLGLRKIDVDMY